MKNFFRLTLVTLLSLVIFGSQSTQVFAQKKDYGLSKTVQSTGNLLPSKIGGASTVPELIGTIVSSVLGFLGVIFFLLVFYAGLVWMTAQGNEEKIERSKEIISAAVVGLVIVLAAYAFTQFIFRELGARGSSASSASSNAAASAPSNPTIVCADLKDFTACNTPFGADDKPVCDWIADGADISVGKCVTASGY